MKLNHDCIRQVLLDIENNLCLDQKHFLKVIAADTVNTYGIDNVLYSILQLNDAGYIDTRITAIKAVKSEDSLVYIKKITWEGHKFLDNIRDSNVWSKTKKILTHFESVSITLISNIASQVITNLITKQID